MPTKLAISVFLLLASIAAVGAAQAAPYTGAQLLALCSANMGGNGNPFEAAECMGYVVGVSDTFDCDEKDHGFTWNSKAGVSQPRLVSVVVEWLKSHPEDLVKEAHIAVGGALASAFPCK